MGATCAIHHVRDCIGDGMLPHDAFELSHSSGSQELVLRVVHAPIDDARGARLSDYTVGTELKVVELSTVHGLDPLGSRFREKARQQWPESYRFQISKRFWQVRVVPDSYLGAERVCLLQMPSSPDDRTLDNAKLDVEDSRVAGIYAQRFNLHRCQHLQNPLGCLPERPSEPQPEAAGIDEDRSPAGELGNNAAPLANAAAFDLDGIPTIKVAAPVACEVIHSGYPSMVPVGSVCTLTPYSENEIQKFVFDGQTDEFMEVPQAFFHYAAFSSGGKEFICDIQGVQDEDGGFLLVDPCVLKAGLPTVRDLIGVAANGRIAGDHALNGPSSERFDALHPKCGDTCKAFDPLRRSAQRNGKAGVCGMGTCGIAFAKCGR